MDQEFTTIRGGDEMESLKCSVQVIAGVIPEEPMPEFTREWHFTKKDMDNPPTYIDKTGSAMNYAMSLQNPERFNWVRLDWIWY